MLKKYLTLLFLATLSAQAQEITQKQAEEVFKNADFVTELTYTEGDPLYDALAKAKKGEVVIDGTELYKVVGHESVLTLRYGSLYLDAEAYSPKTSAEVMVPELVAALKAHKAGDIFAVEVGSDTYVLVKKSEPFSKKAVQVLYMTYE